MKIAKTYNWIVLIYLLIVAVLTFNSNITYGHGIGDLIYLIVLGVLVILQLIITIIIYREQRIKFNPTKFYLCGTVFLFIALFYTWKFTIGRGSEFIWNGNIFYDYPL